MQQQSTALGNIGMTQTLCDNPRCRKPTPVCWKGRNGKYCSNKCLKQVEENMVTEEDDDFNQDNEEVEEAVVEAPKKKAVAKKAAKPAAKKATTKPTKTEKEAKAARKPLVKKGKGVVRDRVDNEAKITIVAADVEMRGARADKWKCLKNGQTVGAAKEAMTKKGLTSVSGFINVCVEKGLIKLAA